MAKRLDRMEHLQEERPHVNKKQQAAREDERTSHMQETYFKTKHEDEETAP